MRRAYKPSPLLAKPGKRSRQEALPSALHMGLSVGLSLLAFAIISVSSTKHRPVAGRISKGGWQ